MLLVWKEMVPFIFQDKNHIYCCDIWDRIGGSPFRVHDRLFSARLKRQWLMYCELHSNSVALKCFWNYSILWERAPFRGLFLASCTTFSDLSSHLYSFVTPKTGTIEREFSRVGCYLNFTISLLEWKQAIRQVLLPWLHVCWGTPDWLLQPLLRVETGSEKCGKNINSTIIYCVRLDWKVQYIPHRILRLKLQH